MMSMPRYQRKANIVTREIAGETLLVPVLQTGVNLQKVYLLNETGADLWGRLDEPRSLDELVQALLDEYEAPEADLRADVADILNDLVESALVDVTEEA